MIDVGARRDGQVRDRTCTLPPTQMPKGTPSLGRLAANDDDVITLPVAPRIPTLTNELLDAERPVSYVPDAITIVA